MKRSIKNIEGMQEMHGMKTTMQREIIIDFTGK